MHENFCQRFNAKGIQCFRYGGDDQEDGHGGECLRPEVELRNGYNFSCPRQALDEFEASTGEGPPGLG